MTALELFIVAFFLFIAAERDRNMSAAACSFHDSD